MFQTGRLWMKFQVLKNCAQMSNVSNTSVESFSDTDNTRKAIHRNISFITSVIVKKKVIRTSESSFERPHYLYSKLLRHLSEFIQDSDNHISGFTVIWCRSVIVHPVYDVVVWCTVSESQEVLVAFMIVDFVHLVPLLKELITHRDDFLAVIVRL